MTEEMYDCDELMSAQGALGTLLGALPEPFVLLGGWAVYHTVQGSYQREHGVPYLGSRDLDVGFHADPSWSDDELRASADPRVLGNGAKFDTYPYYGGTPKYPGFDHGK